MLVCWAVATGAVLLAVDTRSSVGAGFMTASEGLVMLGVGMTVIHRLMQFIIERRKQAERKEVLSRQAKAGVKSEDTDVVGPDTLAVGLLEDFTDGLPALPAQDNGTKRDAPPTFDLDSDDDDALFGPPSAVPTRNASASPQKRNPIHDMRECLSGVLAPSALEAPPRYLEVDSEDDLL